MQLQNRLAKLETRILPPSSRNLTRIEELELLLPQTKDVDDYFAICGEISAIKRFECSHPPGAFRVRQCYPFPKIEGYPHRLVIKAHCDACGYDAPLWDITHTTKDQLKKLQTSDDRHENEYSRWLIANGYLDYVPWTQELADHYNAIGGGDYEYK